MHRFLVVLTLPVAMLCIAGCAGDDSDDAAVTTAADVTPSRLVGVDEFSDRIDEPDVVTINVHVPDEGDLPGTDLSIPFDEISDSDALPDDLDTPLAVYCRSGNMSADVVVDLAALGYTDVAELDGGFNAWVDAGRSLEG